jgi:membrane associated rhomboid family serine protease
VPEPYRPPSSFSILPPVVKNLLILNGLAFLAQMTFGIAMEQWLALWPAGVDVVIYRGQMVAPPSFYPWQLVTTAFLHGGFGHLFFNMLGLWMFGMRIEQVMGSRRFAFFYFACVIGASLLQLLVTSMAVPTDHVPVLFRDVVPTVGASGGVLGVLAAFGLLFPDEPIYLYFFVPIPAKWLVIGLAVLDLYAGIGGSAGGVANFAHLGGMATGALLVQYWRGRVPFRRRPAAQRRPSA